MALDLYKPLIPHKELNLDCTRTQPESLTQGKILAQHFGHLIIFRKLCALAQTWRSLLNGGMSDSLVAISTRFRAIKPNECHNDEAASPVMLVNHQVR